MTATVQTNKKDNKYYIHLNWQENGKRHQKCIGTGLSAKGNNKREAERICREVLREWEQKIAERTTDILFSHYLKQWLEEISYTIAETTRENYRTVLDGVICPYFEEKGIKLRDLTARDIQTFYKFKMDEHGIKANTIRHYHAYIHKALDYAVRMKRRIDNPSDLVMLPRKEKYIAKSMTAEQARLLIERSQGTRIETVVLLGIWFGLRRGEIIGLRWSDINFESKTLYIRGVFSKADRLVYKQPKTTASIRSFPLTDEMVQYFRQLQQRQQENRQRCQDSYNDDWLAYVCVDKLGNLLKLGYVSEAVPKLCLECGMEPFKLHELRHTNISLLLENGANMKEVQEWAGHSDYQTTANIYAHVQAGAKTKLSQSIQGVLK